MRKDEYKEIEEAQQILRNIEVKQQVIDDMTVQIKEGLRIIQRKLQRLDPEQEVLKQDF